MERVWLVAEDDGWSYNDPAAHLLEVLAILRLRNKVSHARQVN